jgi:hypothetical protein
MFGLEKFQCGHERLDHRPVASVDHHRQRSRFGPGGGLLWATDRRDIARAQDRSPEDKSG